MFQKGVTSNIEMPPLVEMSEEEEEARGEESELKSVDIEYEQEVEGTSRVVPPKLKRLQR